MPAAYQKNAARRRGNTSSDKTTKPSKDSKSKETRLVDALMTNADHTNNNDNTVNNTNPTENSVDTTADSDMTSVMTDSSFSTTCTQSDSVSVISDSVSESLDSSRDTQHTMSTNSSGIDLDDLDHPLKAMHEHQVGVISDRNS